MERTKFRIGEICKVEGYSGRGKDGTYEFVKIVHIDRNENTLYPIKINYLVGPWSGVKDSVFLWREESEIIKIEEEDESLLSSLDSIGSL